MYLSASRGGEGLLRKEGVDFCMDNVKSSKYKPPIKLIAVVDDEECGERIHPSNSKKSRPRIRIYKDGVVMDDFFLEWEKKSPIRERFSIALLNKIIRRIMDDIKLVGYANDGNPVENACRIVIRGRFSDGFIHHGETVYINPDFEGTHQTLEVSLKVVNKLLHNVVLEKNHEISLKKKLII
jgi:hypothetical protein